MATSLIAKIALSIGATLASSLDVGEGKYEIAFNPSVKLNNGIGANQAKEAFTDTRTLAASASEELDLSGSLLDAFGATILFTKVKAIVVVAAKGNVNDVVIGGAASNAWATPFGDATDTVKVPPGGFLALTAPGAAGFAVIPGTGDKLKIANGGAGSGVDYTIIVIGVV
jgi:hypothetical protein